MSVLYRGGRPSGSVAALPGKVAEAAERLRVAVLVYQSGVSTIACPHCGGRREVLTASLIRWAKAGQVGRCRRVGGGWTCRPTAGQVRRAFAATEGTQWDSP